MKTASEHIENLISATGEYVETKTQLIKYQAIDKISDAVSSVVSSLAVIIAGVFFFLIVNIGLSILIGQSLGQVYYGFFIVAGFYALIGILLYAFRKKWLKKPVANLLIQKFLK